MKTSIFILVFCSLAMSDTPPDISLPTLVQQVADAKSDLADAINSAIQRFHASDDYRDASADVARKEKALIEARKSGTAQDKVDASSLLNKAKAKLVALDAAAIKGDRNVSAKQKTLDTRQRLLAETKARQERARESGAVHNKDDAQQPDQPNRAFVDRNGQLDQIINEVKSTDIPIAEQSDAYLTYRRKTELVVKAVKIMLSYTTDDSGPTNADEYGKIGVQTARIAVAWNELCTSQERQYPSSAKLLKMLPQLSGEVSAFTILDSMRKSVKRNEDAGAAIEIRISDSKAIFNAELECAKARKRWDDGFDEVLALLRSREGTRPVLPPPPPTEHK